jgi:hypothetical protein
VVACSATIFPGGSAIVFVANAGDQEKIGVPRRASPAPNEKCPTPTTLLALGGSQNQLDPLCASETNSIVLSAKLHIGDTIGLGKPGGQPKRGFAQHVSARGNGRNGQCMASDYTKIRRLPPDYHPAHQYSLP